MKAGFIYVIGTSWGEPVKIGVAQDIIRRMATLQAGNPKELRLFWRSAIFEDVYAVESHLHRHFAHHLVRGEWFNVPDLLTLLAAVDKFSGRVSRTQRAQTDASIACSKAVTALVERIVLKERITTEAAIERAASLLGIKPKSVWSLKYRPPADVWASDYERVAKALWAEAGRDFGELTFLPDPDEMLEVVDVMNIRSIYEPATPPSKDHRENTRAHMQRFDRMVELIAVLQDARKADTLPNEPDETNTQQGDDE